MTYTIILGPFKLCITCTNRHLLYAYYFTSYAYYIYIAVPIQQGTHITDLLIYYFWGTIVCHIFGLPGYTNSTQEQTYRRRHALIVLRPFIA
jgi:hypothetical protein